MKRRVALLVWCLVPWVNGAAQEIQRNEAKSTFLVVYKPGPAWVQGKPVSEQPLKEHGKYKLSLYAKGVLKFAGPFADDAGGAVVLEVANETEARAIVAEDPAVKSHVFLNEMHPWALVEWDKYLKK